MNIKNENIDIILQFIIATAGQEDNKWERELGNIHLIKYLYLADLSYAKHNNGTIFTNLEWRFHHFGPWTVDAYKRIEPALNSIGADKKHYKSKYGDDFIRWSLQDDEIYTELKNKLPCSLASSIESYVHKYNSSTEDLLDYVYKTWPMLKARPEELLDFKLQSFFNAGNHTNCTNTYDKEISKKKQKLKKIALKNLKDNIQKKLKNKNEKRKFIPRPSRYDDVYYSALETFDFLAGTKIIPFDGTAYFSEDIWTSEARRFSQYAQS